MNNSDHKSCNIDIFISHCSEDKNLIEKIVNLIRKAFNLTTNSIRCTSLDGYKLRIGTDTNSTLRMEVNQSKVFVGIVTRNSIKSIYTMFEFGARWGSGLLFLPVICDTLGTSLLKSPLKEINAANANDESSIHQFLEDVGEILKKEIEKASSYNDDIKELVHFISEEYPQSNDVFDKKSTNVDIQGKEISLSATSLNIPFNTKAIVSIEGENIDKCNYSINDDFYAHADTKNGKIEIIGKKVGATDLIVNSGKYSAKCNINITPMNTFCGNPKLRFYESYQQVKELCNNVIENEKNTFAYKEGDIWHHYYFERDKGLILVISIVKSTKNIIPIIEANNCMRERYNMITSSVNNTYWYQQHENKFLIACKTGTKSGECYFFYSPSKDLIDRNLDFTND